ncbi:heterogeneous nuclear ribonucleoprotein 27C-like [Tropilaelaps mercedesae]|uniref:Heterogeneous nuclear ribonucleoprotein 27C-like n=1 Tax=Tropilaelaps mercedesae TaxID=418985 RepID=A0A1V9XP97_9ACAR|nr:heterogeneous nuclear ribonucleoprotein 27C-like [Tropilaelaps mercedesae]
MNAAPEKSPLESLNSWTCNKSSIANPPNIGGNGTYIGELSGGGSKMFVGGLSWCTTRHSLAAYFGLFGNIEDCTVVTNEQGRSRGFGFVTYRDPCIAFIVCQRGPHSVDNRVVDPKPCGQNGNHMKVPGRVMRPYPKVFTGGLPASLTENGLGQFFRENYGNFTLQVLEVVIMFDQESSRSRGFGFVTFQEERVADKVCKEHYIFIKGKKVECNRAQPRFLPTCSSAAIQLPFGSSGTGTARVDRLPEKDVAPADGSAGCGSHSQDELELPFPTPSKSLFGYDYGMDRAGGGSRRCAFLGPFRRITPQQKYAAFPHQSSLMLKAKDSLSNEPLLSLGSVVSTVVGPKVDDEYCCWRDIKDHQEAGPSWKAPGNPLPSSTRSCTQRLIE